MVSSPPAEVPKNRTRQIGRSPAKIAEFGGSPPSISPFPRAVQSAGGSAERRGPPREGLDIFPRKSA